MEYTKYDLRYKLPIAYIVSPSFWIKVVQDKSLHKVKIVKRKIQLKNTYTNGAYDGFSLNWE